MPFSLRPPSPIRGSAQDLTEAGRERLADAPSQLVAQASGRPKTHSTVGGSENRDPSGLLVTSNP